MKNLKLFFALCVVALILQSCKKDNQFIEDPITSTQPESLRKRSCKMEGHMHELMANPAYKKQHENKFRKLEALNGRRYSMRENAILPMAVHFQGVSDPDIECLRILAQSQIDILNNDYRGTNADINEWTDNAASSFPGIQNGAATFRFCLANKNHPAGYNLSDGDLAVTVNATEGDFDEKWSGYINVFVQYNTGVLGYAPLGGTGNGDGVVIDASAFGTGNGCGTIKPDAPFNLGRTLTHELGHYLLLDHIWGDGCATDDEVADTPESDQPYYDCPNLGEQTCESTDMHMNYMDYTNDACMYMFSNGQVTRSTNYLGTSLAAVMDNAANVCGDVTNGGDGDNGGDTGGDGDNGGDNGGDGDNDSDGDNGGDEGTDPTTGCVAPTIFEYGFVDANNAFIIWDPITDATNYHIQFKGKDQTAWYTVTSSTNSVDLANLAPETDYEFRVRTRCGDERASWSDIQSFRTGNHGCDESGTCTDLPIFLQLGLDDYGSETSWELTDSEGNIIADGSGYEDGKNGELIEEELCLSDGCYTFTLYDEFGDGICCDYGDGFFQLLNLDGSVLVASDGLFGEFVSAEICVNSTEAEGRGRKVSINKGARDPQVIARGRATKK